MAVITAGKGIRYLGAAILAIVGLLLMLTNPNQSGYSEFATQQTLNLLLKDICQANQQRTEILEQLWGNSCETFPTNGASEIQQFVTHNTQRKNLVFCSLYTTELPLYSLKVLGISNQFIVLSFGSSQ